jgi:hypothetical protein
LEGDESSFSSLPPPIKCELVAFLMRKCLATKAMRECVDQSHDAVSKLRAEKRKAIKDVREQVCVCV